MTIYTNLASIVQCAKVIGIKCGGGDGVGISRSG